MWGRISRDTLPASLVHEDAGGFLWLFGLEVMGPGHQGREHRDVEGSPGACTQALVQAPD